MARPDGSDVQYTLYDKVSRLFLDGYHFVLNDPCYRCIPTFDKAYGLRRDIMKHHKANHINSDIVIIKVSKVWDEVEGSY